MSSGRARDETAVKRDEAAQRRDRVATGRDRDAEIADQRVLEHEDSDGGLGSEPTPQVQELQARAIEDHKRAAENRVSARQDRECGERDRANSRRDREHALADGRSLVRAERVGRDLALQRTRLINAQSLGQFGSWEWDIATDSTVWSGGAVAHIRRHTDGRTAGLRGLHRERAPRRSGERPCAGRWGLPDGRAVLF